MIEQLILVRHGETVDNVRGVAQGWSDSELSARGQEQIRKVAARLPSFGVTGLYCSTLPRAMTTASMISSTLGLQPVPLDDLREMNCGRWEGQHFSALQQADRDLHQLWSTDPSVACPDGESFADVLLRMNRAIATIGTLEDGKQSVPLLVSHGTAIRIALSGLLGLPLQSARSFAQDNAAINIFVRRGDRFVLKLWNDTTHCS
ncbi:MAG TPA: histidine phosphatase family protein [Thermoanaerobaculia bacterium]|nr:histidine phosphatase family protein [Thermoanaerobaculia bacterium]